MMAQSVDRSTWASVAKIPPGVETERHQRSRVGTAGVFGKEVESAHAPGSMHRIRGRPVDKSVGSRLSGSGFRALGASRLLSEQSRLNRGSPGRRSGYLRIASWSGIHWSPRGVHVTRSRMA